MLHMQVHKHPRMRAINGNAIEFDKYQVRQNSEIHTPYWYITK